MNASRIAVIGLFLVTVIAASFTIGNRLKQAPDSASQDEDQSLGEDSDKADGDSRVSQSEIPDSVGPINFEPGSPPHIAILTPKAKEYIGKFSTRLNPSLFEIYDTSEPENPPLIQQQDDGTSADLTQPASEANTENVSAVFYRSLLGQSPPADLSEEEIEEKAHERIEDTMSKILTSNVDTIQQNVASSLLRTGRLTVMDPIELRSTIDRLNAKRQSRVAPSSNDVVKETVSTPELVFSFLWAGISGKDDAGAPKRTELERARVVETADQQAVSFAARDINATHLLVVNVSEPRYEHYVQQIADTNKRLHVLEMNPVISYRLVDLRTGFTTLSDVTQPLEPVQIVFENGRPPTATQESRAEMEQGRDIAQIISARLLDTLFPAEIVLVQDNVIAMDRGRNDGVQVGDVFEVFRKIGRVSGVSNVALREEATVPVGSVRVMRVSDSLAYLQRLSGNSPILDDIIEFSGSEFESRRNESTNKGANSNRSMSLGGEFDTGMSETLPRIMVRNFDIRFIDCNGCGASTDNRRYVENMFLNDLNKEGRIEVFSSQDIDTSLDQRRFIDQSQGRNQRLGVSGMAAARYAMTGELRIQSRQSLQTERVAGRVVERGTKHTLHTTGLVRVIDVETGRLMSSTDISFSQNGTISEASLQRVGRQAAASATEDILKALFPAESQ